MRGGIDLVMPLHNEAQVLDATFANLAAQVDGDGVPLPRGFLRVVAVDNASTDDTLARLHALSRDPAMPEVVVLQEPVKGVVQARVRGSEYAMRPEQRAHRPHLLHMDADNTFSPGLVWDAWRLLDQGHLDAVTYRGFRPTRFWQHVPELAALHFDTMGGIDFSDAQMRVLGLDPARAVLTASLFDDFEQFPVQWAFAMTKDMQAACGGYIREFHDDGTERLGEARNTMYRVVRAGARTACATTAWVEINLRRLVLDALRLGRGESYVGTMRDIRAEPGPEHFEALRAQVAGLDLRGHRRNFVQRCIVEPCLAKPELVLQNAGVFGPAAQSIHDEICRWHDQHDTAMYLGVWPLSVALVERLHADILRNIAAQRGLPAPL